MKKDLKYHIEIDRKTCKIIEQGFIEFPYTNTIMSRISPEYSSYVFYGKTKETVYKRVKSFYKKKCKDIEIEYKKTLRIFNKIETILSNLDKE